MRGRVRAQSGPRDIRDVFLELIEECDFTDKCGARALEAVGEHHQAFDIVAALAMSVRSGTPRARRLITKLAATLQRHIDDLGERRVLFRDAVEAAARSSLGSLAAELLLMQIKDEVHERRNAAAFADTSKTKVGRMGRVDGLSVEQVRKELAAFRPPDVQKPTGRRGNSKGHGADLIAACFAIKYEMFGEGGKLTPANIAKAAARFRTATSKKK